MWCKECGKRFAPQKRRAGMPKEYCSERCRKRRWDRENAWKRKDNCPSCGGMKMIIADYCRRCMKPTNPEGINGRDF